MKGIWIASVFLAAAVLFFSCNFGTESRASLCIRNCSDKDNLAVTAVYIKGREDAGYERVWTGSLESGTSEFIFIDEGSYSVRIDVADIDLFGFSRTFTTGYNIYKEAGREETLYVCFDGGGVYFEE